MGLLCAPSRDAGWQSTRVCTHTHTHVHTHACTHVYTRTHVCTRAHTCAQPAHTCMHTDRSAHMGTHTPIHTCTHKHTHTCTHAHTHTPTCNTLAHTCTHTWYNASNLPSNSEIALGRGLSRKSGRYRRDGPCVPMVSTDPEHSLGGGAQAGSHPAGVNGGARPGSTLSVSGGTFPGRRLPRTQGALTRTCARGARGGSTPGCSRRDRRLAVLPGCSLRPERGQDTGAGPVQLRGDAGPSPEPGCGPLLGAPGASCSLLPHVPHPHPCSPAPVPFSASVSSNAFSRHHRHLARSRTTMLPWK